MAQSSLAPVREGDLLAGKYRIEHVLGVGGMGVVVAARHEELGQLVAIKFVRDQALGNAEAVERFLREARAAVKLRSEHVARVLDVGKLESGAPYMVMEFLEGRDLSQILDTDGPMPLAKAVALVLQACEAVAEAHSAGIVHRDLKPQNLFLTRTVGGFPKLKVLDFGVSKATGLTSDGRGALTRTSAMLGSPLYMAPEQMRSSRDVDARVDIWALGVVLYELLTCRWPFEAESMPELCLKVVAEPPTSLAARRPEVPAGLVAAVERCLEKDPAKRFPAVSELAHALEPFASSPSLAAPRTSQITDPPAETRTATLPSEQSSPGGSSTPAAWDSARPSKLGGPQETNPPRRQRTPAVRWTAAALIAIGAAGGFALAWRGLGGAATPEPLSPSSMAPRTTAVSSPPAAATVAPEHPLPPSAATGQANGPPEEIKLVALLDAGPSPANSTSSLSGAADSRSSTTPGNRERLAGTPIASPKPTAPARSRPRGKASAPDDDIPTLR
jgi:serine/threonine protein kinase